MQTQFNFSKPARRAKAQKVAGLIILMLGLSLSVQMLARASEDDDQVWSVRSEATDMQMFGKKLSTLRIRPMQAIQELRPGTGPVVPTRLRIPALGIDTNVEEVGLHNGAMDVPTNIWNAGWLHSSPRPGDMGNAVLDGHKDNVRGGAIFYDLGNLKVGDRVYVSDAGSYELAFEVTEKQSYLQPEAPLERIFGDTTERQLNLITCDGDFIRDQASYNKRLVVFTRLVTDN